MAFRELNISSRALAIKYLFAFSHLALNLVRFYKHNSA
jgi:hypothetical protein